MSGGRFDYDQYKIGHIADDIEQVIERNGREKTKEELKEESWRTPDWYEQYPEDRFWYEYPPEVIEKFKIAVQKLREAQIYAHRIDWLLSGDDGEETFLERLEDELKSQKELYTYSRDQVHKLMCKSFEAGYKKHDVVEAGLEHLDTEVECSWILTRFDSTPK